MVRPAERGKTTEGKRPALRRRPGRASGNGRGRSSGPARKRAPATAGWSPQDDPGRRMIAGPLLAANAPVVPRRLQPSRGRGVEQEMVDPKASIAGPAVPLVVPEG